jgi:hypothetical protein
MSAWRRSERMSTPTVPAGPTTVSPSRDSSDHAGDIPRARSRLGGLRLGELLVPRRLGNVRMGGWKREQLVDDPLEHLVELRPAADEGGDDQAADPVRGAGG